MKNLQARKHRIFDIIQIGQVGDIPSRLFDFTILLMILVNLFISIVETFDVSSSLLSTLSVLELITVIGFAVEYLLRLWTVEYLFPDLSRPAALGRYVLSFSGIVDLLSFLPYFIPVFFPAGIVTFRMFRVVRIFRLFRVNAYYDALNVIADVLKSKKNQLMSSIFIILVLMTGASLCMYSLEHEAQPEVFANAFSGFWWAVSSLLTVGYGDIYPITVAGKVFGIIITFLGVGMVAIPTGILSAGFVEQYTTLNSAEHHARRQDMQFIHLSLDSDSHPWLHRTVKELQLPPGLFLAVIQREDDILIPRDNTILLPGDHLILSAERLTDDFHVELKEIVLQSKHPWVGKPIRDLDISRLSLIVMVRRNDRFLIPTGSTTMLVGDTVLLYTRLPIADSTTVTL